MKMLFKTVAIFCLFCLGVIGAVIINEGMKIAPDEALKASYEEAVENQAIVNFSSLSKKSFDRMLVITPYIPEEWLIEEGLRVDRLKSFRSPLNEVTTVLFMKGKEIAFYMDLYGTRSALLTEPANRYQQDRFSLKPSEAIFKVIRDDDYRWLVWVGQKEKSYLSDFFL